MLNNFENVSRIFIGIEIPKSIKLDELAFYIKEEIDFFRPFLSFHMTLVFIGNVENDLLEKNSKLDAAIFAASKSIFKPIQNLRFLPCAYIMGKTISLKLEDNLALEELVNNLKLNLDLNHISYSKNSDIFCPHVALGRFSYSEKLLLKKDYASFLESISVPKNNFGFDVKDFILYKSLNNHFIEIRRYII